VDKFIYVLLFRKHLVNLTLPTAPLLNTYVATFVTTMHL